jgi:hypothetical protein
MRIKIIQKYIYICPNNILFHIITALIRAEKIEAYLRFLERPCDLNNVLDLVILIYIIYPAPALLKHIT